MEEFTPTQERRIGLYFKLSVWGKGLISAAEIVGGILAFFVPVSVLTNIVIYFAQGELIEDPHDAIASFLSHSAQQFSLVGGTFIGLYLLSRGVIKLLLVWGLLKNQLWAYPSSLVVLGLFIIYQCYQIAVTQSVFIIALTIFDLIVMWFIWREWEVVKEHGGHIPLDQQ